MMRTDVLTSSLSEGSQFSGLIRSESAGPAALGLDGGRGAHLLGSDQAAELARILALAAVGRVSSVTSRRQNNSRLQSVGVWREGGPLMAHRAEAVQDPQRPLLVATLRLRGWPASQPFAANISPSPTFSAGFRTLKCEMEKPVILILTWNSLYRGEISILRFS